MFELTLIRHYLSLWTKHDFCINQDIWMFIENITQVSLKHLKLVFASSLTRVIKFVQNTLLFNVNIVPTNSKAKHILLLKQKSRC